MRNVNFRCVLTKFDLFEFSEEPALALAAHIGNFEKCCFVVQFTNDNLKAYYENFTVCQE